MDACQSRVQALPNVDVSLVRWPPSPTAASDKSKFTKLRPCLMVEPPICSSAPDLASQLAASLASGQSLSLARWPSLCKHLWRRKTVSCASESATEQQQHQHQHQHVQQLRIAGNDGSAALLDRLPLGQRSASSFVVAVAVAVVVVGSLRD